MKRLIILTIILSIFLNCEKKITETEFEQNIFDQILLKVIDSTYKDKRLYTFYPLPGMKGDNLEFQKQREILKKDTINLVIAIEENRKINFEKLKSRKFIFKKLSEIHGEDIEYEKWSKKYSKFAGAMSFSKISFDEKHENGKLTVSYSCGGKCGLGYEVFIKKEKQNWEITEIKRIWIA